MIWNSGSSRARLVQILIRVVIAPRGTPGPCSANSLACDLIRETKRTQRPCNLIRETKRHSFGQFGNPGPRRLSYCFHEQLIIYLIWYYWKKASIVTRTRNINTPWVRRLTNWSPACDFLFSFRRRSAWVNCLRQINSLHGPALPNDY